MYYNTTKQEGEQLKLFEDKASSQDEEVLTLMSRLKESSPSMIHRRMNTKSPITSIRRSLSNLTKRGKLVKTGRQVLGDFGRPEHVWSINL